MVIGTVFDLAPGSSTVPCTLQAAWLSGQITHFGLWPQGLTKRSSSAWLMFCMWLVQECTAAGLVRIMSAISRILEGST